MVPACPLQSSEFCEEDEPWLTGCNCRPSGNRGNSVLHSVHSCPIRFVYRPNRASVHISDTHVNFGETQLVQLRLNG